MRITQLKANSEQCNECPRRAIYRVRIRIATFLLCDHCAVHLVVRLVELIALREASEPSPRVARSRKTLIRKF
jgi:hypothetical protein